MVNEHLDNQDFKPLKLYKKQKEQFSGTSEKDKEQQDKIDQNLETNDALKDVEKQTHIRSLDQEFDVFEGETGEHLTDLFENPIKGTAYPIKITSKEPIIIADGIESEKLVLIKYGKSGRFLKAAVKPMKFLDKTTYPKHADFLIPEEWAAKLKLVNRRGNVSVYYQLKEGAEFPTSNHGDKVEIDSEIHSEGRGEDAESSSEAVDGNVENEQKQPISKMKKKIEGDAKSLRQAYLERGKITIVSPPPAIVYNVVSWKIAVGDLEFDSEGNTTIQKEIDGLPYEITIKVNNGVGVMSLKNLSRDNNEGSNDPEENDDGNVIGDTEAETEDSNANETGNESNEESEGNEEDESVESNNVESPSLNGKIEAKVTHNLKNSLGITGEVVSDYTDGVFRLMVLEKDGSSLDYVLDSTSEVNVDELKKNKESKKVKMKFGGGYHEVTVDASKIPLSISLQEYNFEDVADTINGENSSEGEKADNAQENTEVFDSEIYYFPKDNGISTQKFGYEIVDGVYKKLKNIGPSHEDFDDFFVDGGEKYRHITIKRKGWTEHENFMKKDITEKPLIHIDVQNHAFQPMRRYKDLEGDIWEVTIKNIQGILQVSVVAPLEEKATEDDAEEAAEEAAEEEAKEEEMKYVDEYEALVKEYKSKGIDVRQVTSDLISEGKIDKFNFHTKKNIDLITTECELVYIKKERRDFKGEKRTKLSAEQWKEIETSFGSQDGISGITSNSELSDARKEVNAIIAKIEQEVADLFKWKNKYSSLVKEHPSIDFDVDVLPKTTISNGSDVDTEEEYDAILGVVNDIIKQLKEEEEEAEVIFDKRWQDLTNGQESKLSYLSKKPKAVQYYTQVQGGYGIPHNVSTHFKRSIDKDGKAKIVGYPYALLNSKYESLESHKIELGKNISVPLNGWGTSTPTIQVRFELGYKKGSKTEGGIIMKIVDTPDTNSKDWLHRLDNQERVLRKNTIRPLKGGVKVVTSHFGMRKHPHGSEMKPHKGVDLRVKPNQEVLATMDGTINAISYDKGGYGYYVVLKHKVGGKTYYSLYAHLTKAGFNLAKRKRRTANGRIKAGEQIGIVGGTKESTHLHFELRKSEKSAPIFDVGSVPIDPIQFFDASKIEVKGEDGKLYQLEENSRNKTSANVEPSSIPSSTESFAHKKLSDISFGESVTLLREIFSTGPGSDLVVRLADKRYGENETQKKNFILRILAIGYHEAAYDFGKGNKDGANQIARGTFQVSSTELLEDANKALTKAHKLAPDASLVLQRSILNIRDNYRIGENPKSVRQADLLLWLGHIMNHREDELEELGRVSEARLSEHIRDKVQVAKVGESEVGNRSVADLAQGGADVSKYVDQSRMWTGVIVDEIGEEGEEIEDEVIQPDTGTNDESTEITEISVPHKIDIKSASFEIGGFDAKRLNTRLKGKNNIRLVNLPGNVHADFDSGSKKLIIRTASGLMLDSFVPDDFGIFNLEVNSTSIFRSQGTRNFSVGGETYRYSLYFSAPEITVLIED